MLLFSLVSAVSAQDCASSLSPDAMSERIDSVKEGVLFGEPSAGVELAALEAELVCLSGPVDRSELGRLMLARGAYSIFLGQDGAPWLARAVALEASPDPDFGPQVQQAMEAISDPGTATLVLDFDPEPAVLVLDGQVRYSLGVQSVNAGWHLLQWLGDAGWEARVVSVEAGGSERVAVHGPLQVVDAPMEQTPTASPDMLELGVGVGYQVARARLYDSGLAYAGTMGAPVIALHGRTLGVWHVRANADLVSIASGTRSGATNRAALAGGWQQEGGVSWAMGLGLLLGGGVAFGPDSDTKGPDFEPRPRAGALVFVAAQPLPVLSVDLQGQWLAGGYGGHLGMDLRAVELAQLPLHVIWSANYWSEPELGTLSWVQLGVGTRVVF